ncbi:MAG: hypothetical protein K1X94_03605 [Sandaracinaceae bacterium]|nr:hypothetical protein [Sandaracinaceae bacterium]
MNTLLLRRTWLPALLVVSACYDSGSPSVDNPRPAQACYFYTSTSIRYYVFQELEQGCGVLSIPPLATVPEGREPARQYDSSGVFWSRGFAQDPTVSVTQVTCEQLIQQDLFGAEAPELDGVSGKRGWVDTWVIADPQDAELPSIQFLSASIDFEPDPGAPTATVRVRNFDLTDRESVHACVME